MHLVGFIIRNSHDSLSSECQTVLTFFESVLWCYCFFFGHALSQNTNVASPRPCGYVTFMWNILFTDYCQILQRHFPYDVHSSLSVFYLPLFIPAMSHAVFTFNSIPFIKKYDFVSLCDDLVGVTFWTQIICYCLDYSSVNSIYKQSPSLPKDSQTKDSQNCEESGGTLLCSHQF